VEEAADGRHPEERAVRGIPTGDPSPCLLRLLAERSDDGSCSLKDRVGALKAHLPAVIEAILPIPSDRMDEDVAAIEAPVCRGCARGAWATSFRDKAQYALYSYPSLVADAAEAVHEQEPKGRHSGSSVAG
jgi:hypothetical protein